MKKIYSLLLVLALAHFSACAKKEFQIGREDPEKEIQKCVQLSEKKHYEEAVQCLEIFKSRFPDTPSGQEAGLKIADTQFLQHQYLLAADSYLAFAKLNPNHPQTEYAFTRAGLSYLQEAPKAIDRDQEYLYKARETLNKAAQFHGTYHDLVVKTSNEIDGRLARRLFYIGRFYYRTGEYQAAIPRLEELVQKYPKTPRVPKGLYLLTQSNLKLGKIDKAREAVQNLIENFPKESWTKKAQDHYIKVAKKS